MVESTERVPKPLLLRIAPALLFAYAAYTAAFLILAFDSGSDGSFGIGDATIAGPALAAVAGVLVLRVCVYVALAWGFRQGYSWSRPVLVFEGPAILLLLLLVAPDIARLEILMSLPAAAMFSLAFYAYLYWKPNVRQYWERIS